MSRIEKFLERAEESADKSMAVTEYGLVLEGVHIMRGMSAYEAERAVREIKTADKQGFIEKAIELDDYRKRITEGPNGIPIEMFNHAINKDPITVMADAVRWAQINGQINE